MTTDINDLVQAVDELTTQTTALLDTVTVSKVALDTAVIDAQEAKTGAELARNQSTDEADRSRTEANRSETEADRSTTEADRAATHQALVAGEGNVQVARLQAEGDTQVGRAETEGDAQVVRLQAEGDTQAARAKTEADRATSEANKAVSANNSAQAALSATNQAKADATAIVYEGEFSQTSKPGSVAVADANGHMDIGWTPHLAAMYPYSGVLGSVNKTDIFVFHGDTPDRFHVNSSDVAFNIAGRFVVLPANAAIQLGDAPSSVETAVSFDDIFIDHGGNIVVLRSYEPCRTSTGYDRDAIATQYGFTKIQNGLYLSGESYLLLLGRVARRNKGAYHPVFNPEGCSRVVFTPESGQPGGDRWYGGNVVTLFSTEDAFTKHTGTGGVISLYSGRPDHKAFDAVYADDFTPLYYSAKNVVDRQALLFDSFNRAVAGETFSGAEGTPTFTHLTTDIVSVGDVWIGLKYNPTNRDGIEDWSNFNGGTAGTMLMVHAEKTYYWRFTNTWAGTHFSETLGGDNFVWTDIASVGDTVDLYYLMAYEFNNDSTGSYLNQSATPQFMMVDIIGSLDAMPDEWKEHAIPGNWLAVDEDGENLIPDGTGKHYKLSRKCLECYQVLQTSDKGVTWTDITSAWKASFEDAANGGNASFVADDVVMVFYRTSANPFELATRTSFQALGNAAYISAYLPTVGSLLVSALINKVSVEAGWPYTGTTYVQINNAFNMLHYHSTSLPLHGDFKIRHPNAAKLPCVKMLPCLVGNNLHIVYKEMKHNGSYWGDDKLFNIIDNQSTITDLNGDSVIVGQRRVELPYHFNGETY